MDMELKTTRMPGFFAEASLTSGTGNHYISRQLSRSGSAKRSRVAPAQYEPLYVLDPYSSSSYSETGSEGPEDVCDKLKKCCNQGYIDCCIAYNKGCT